MTALWCLLSLTTGLTLGAAVTYRVMLVRCDLHNYRKVALEAARIRDVCADADHEHRLRLRREAELDSVRPAIGALLDQVQIRERRIKTLTTRPRYPLRYGRELVS